MDSMRIKFDPGPYAVNMAFYNWSKRTSLSIRANTCSLFMSEATIKCNSFSVSLRITGGLSLEEPVDEHRWRSIV